MPKTTFITAHLPDLHIHRTLLLVITSSLMWPSFGYADDAEIDPSVVELETVVVEGKAATKLGPLEGLQLSREQIPSNVQSLSSKDIRDSNATSLGDLMNSRLQSVNVNDYAGNPFQMDITFRGFSASPQLGTPQGLSVFLDGVRVNEPFGDVVNWDLIPINALGSMDIFPGSNPLFGLNTLGGALSLRTKNGFDDAGADVKFTGGSWNRKKGEVSAGWNNGTVGAFMAFTGFDEEGWRTNSPSQVNQGFARLDWRGDDFSVRFSTLAVGNNLIGNGLIPTDLYNKNPESVFTSPDSTENNLQQYTLGGEFFLNDNLSLTGQIYRRDSNRKSVAGDIYEDFEDISRGDLGRPYKANVTGQPVCRYPDANKDGIRDYGLDMDDDELVDPGTINVAVSPNDSRFLLGMPALNPGCSEISYTNLTGPLNGAEGDNTDPISPDPLVSPTGVIEGTPIGILSKTAIDQNTDGASLQLNWNSDEHKFMAGGSVDAANTDFDTSQRLGFIDANRRVYSDPANMNPIFVAGQQDIHNNSFIGKSTTFSGYFSETYSPWDNLHLSLSGRINHTRVKNQLRARARAGFQNLHAIKDPNHYRPTSILCNGDNLASCSNSPNYDDRNFKDEVLLAQNPYYGLGKFSETPTSETFDYTSFNPSVGISYLPFKDQDVPYKDLNLFFNWSQGTRTPSSVGLGCAYDGILVPQNPSDPNSQLTPKSFATIGGACTLPTGLSGDPFLPQIFANSFELGMRGKLFDDWEWNTSIFRTDLKDDIYLVGITADRSFFDTIGETRRQGIEFGFSGKAGIVDFGVNYGYTDATFQSNFFMVSPHNSSAAVLSPDDQLSPDQFDASGRPLRALNDMIEVKPGDQMPGIPLHNINASLNFHLTDQWEFGINMIAHSSSFVRGNENNDHQQGAYDYYYGIDTSASASGQVLIKGRQFKDSGSVPGYAIFNLKTRYEIVKGFSVFGMVNNLFDRQYASAGRLGINPFSPSERGAIGPSGWNYNSNDWQSRTFIGPGAPRAYWVGLEFQF
jgi:iron complex outermembrane recepter protein